MFYDFLLPLGVTSTLPHVAILGCPLLPHPAFLTLFVWGVTVVPWNHRHVLSDLPASSHGFLSPGLVLPCLLWASPGLSFQDSSWFLLPWKVSLMAWSKLDVRAVIRELTLCAPLFLNAQHAVMVEFLTCSCLWVSTRRWTCWRLIFVSFMSVIPVPSRVLNVVALGTYFMMREGIIITISSFLPKNLGLASGFSW